MQSLASACGLSLAWWCRGAVQDAVGKRMAARLHKVLHDPSDANIKTPNAAKAPDAKTR